MLLTFSFSISPSLSLLLLACLLSLLSHVQLFVTPWTVACQAPLSVEFSRPEYWSGLPFRSPGDLPTPGIELTSLAMQADSLPLSHWQSPMIIMTWPQISLNLLRSVTCGTT